MPELEYVLAHKAESFGNDSAFGLQILLAAGRPLTDADQRLFYKVADEIMEAVRRETVRLDPAKRQAWHEERAELLRLFPLPIFYEEIPYEYCNRWCCSHRHWLLVTTGIGRVKIGWRKRVIEIDWSQTLCSTPAEVLFPEEQVTRAARMIHAWDYERAGTYLGTILGNAPLSNPIPREAAEGMASRAPVPQGVQQKRP